MLFSIPQEDGSHKKALNSSAIAEYDAQITCSELLEAKLIRRLNGRVRDLRVIPQDGGVILKGRASTYYAKQLAQHALLEETKLPLVGNEIEICSRRIR
jgi:hypothetical protein